MRVGVDARLLSEPINGIRRYTAELTKALSNKPGEFYVYSAGPVAAEQWQKDNVMFRSANLHGRVSRMLWSQTCLPYWAAKDHVDVFWGTTHRLPFYLPKEVARVVTIHDLVWKHAGETMRPMSRWMEKRLMPHAIRQADRIVADSISTVKAIEVEYPAVRDRIRLVYPGTTNLPSPLDFQSLSSFGIVHPYFLFVGTLEPRKNLQRLLEAYALLNAETRSCARLVITGGKGWGDVNLADLLKKLNLTSEVTITGYVDDIQLSTLYANARFLAMPSLYEGFGLPLVEAMNFGVPVLTSDRSSLLEVAGEAGIFVNAFDVRSIAEGLSSLLSDDVYRDQLASRATPNAKRFSWHNAAAEMRIVFEEAIKARADLQRTARR